MSLRTESTVALLRDTASRFFTDPTREGETQDELWQAMAALGWLGIVVPEAFDGSGSDFVHLAVLLEELGRSGARTPLLECATAVLLASAAEPVPTDLLRALGGGELTAATVAPLDQLRWARIAEDGRSMSFSKTVVPWASETDQLLVLALGRSEPMLVGLDLNSAAIVSTTAKTFDGISAALIEINELPLSAATYVARVDPVRAREIVAIVAVLRIVEMLGIAQYALDSAITYVTNRHQFGRPLSSFQVIQHAAANMAMELDATRLLAYEAATNASTGRPFLRSAAACVIRGTRACEKVVLSSSQLHGGIGFLTEFPLHRYYTRVKAEQIRLGTRSQLRRWAAPLLLDATPRMPFPEITAS
jgi:alkylation response protein AidB-like acyl-CoA dehydrogenase